MYESNLGGVFRLYRAALSRCWLPSLLLALVWSWVATRLDRRLGSDQDLLKWVAQVQALIWSGYFWRLLIAAGAVSALLYSVMVADIYAVATGGGVPAGAGFASGIRAFPAVLVAATLFMLGTTAASVFFIVPGAYLWGMWQLWLIVLVVERSGPLTALATSWHLVEGAWWRITTLVTVVTIISAVPSLLFDALTGTILVLQGRDAAHPPAVMNLAGVLLDTLVLPLVPTALVAAYLERQRAPAQHG
jgi:hypothetical protein